MRRTARHSLVLKSLVGAVGFATSACAQYVEWRGFDFNNGLYLFSDSQHWDTTVPGAADQVIFTGAGTNGIPQGSIFTVRLTSNQGISYLDLKDGEFEVTLDLDGKTLTAANLNYVASSVGTGPVLGITGGSTASVPGGLRIGLNADTKGEVHVFGQNTILNPGNQLTYVGSSGSGILRLSDGASLQSTRQVQAGLSAGGHGTIHLGSGATLTTTNHFWIGDRGSGDLVIEGGASAVVTGGNNIAFSLRGNTDQVVTGLMTGSGSLLRHAATNADRGITIAGGPRNDVLVSSGSVHVTVANGARMESTRLILLWNNARLTMDNGTAVAEGDFEAYTGSVIDMVLYNGDRDAIVQAGNLNLQSGVTLNLSLGAGATFDYGEFVELFNTGGTRNGTFANHAESDTVFLGDYEFLFTYAGGASGTSVGLTVIPEPGSVALFFLGIPALLLRRRLSHHPA